MCVSVLNDRIVLCNPSLNECYIQVLRKSLVLLGVGWFLFIEEPKNRIGSVSVVNANFALCQQWHWQIYGLFISAKQTSIHRAACFLAWVWRLPSTSYVADVRLSLLHMALFHTAFSHTSSPPQPASLLLSASARTLRTGQDVAVRAAAAAGSRRRQREAGRSRRRQQPERAPHAGISRAAGQ